MIGGTPSRLRTLRELRRKMDEELAMAIEPDVARERGLSPITEILGTRLWDNVIFAIRTLRETPEDRDAVMVRLREGRSIQVWARPTGTIRD